MQTGEVSDAAELSRRYLNGESIQTITATGTVSTATVRRQLLAAGVELRPAGTARRLPGTATLVQLHNSGVTAVEIAGRYQVTIGAVCNALTRTGIARPSQRPTNDVLRHLSSSSSSVSAKSRTSTTCPNKQSAGG